MEQKADDFIPTRESLLGRIKNWEDQESWREFFNIYRHLIYSTASKSGLTQIEAEEVVQETLISVAKTIKDFKYDRKRCTFKSWLGHLTRKRIADQFRKRDHRIAQATSDADTAQTPAVERMPDPQGFNLEAFWEEQWQEKLLVAAIDKIKREITAEQFQIFDLHVLRKMSVGEVTSALGVSSGQVYLTKHRVSRLIKREVIRLEAQMSQGLNRG